MRKIDVMIEAEVRLVNVILLALKMEEEATTKEFRWSLNALR